MQDPLQTASYAAPALVALLTLPPLWRFAGLIRHRKTAKVDRDAVYEDKDGAATEESMKNYSTKASFTAVFLANALGFASSLSLVVVATVYHFHDVTRIWLLFWSWVCPQPLLFLLVPTLIYHRFSHLFRCLILSANPGS